MTWEIYQPFSAVEQLMNSIKSMFVTLGILALVLVLILGLIYFAPTIIASMRGIRLKILVCIINVGAIPLLFVRLQLPPLLWLILMIVAIAGKRKKSTEHNVPNIIIQTRTRGNNAGRK